jgi:hypothetical protein
LTSHITLHHQRCPIHLLSLFSACDRQCHRRSQCPPAMRTMSVRLDEIFVDFTIKCLMRVRPQYASGGLDKERDSSTRSCCRIHGTSYHPSLGIACFRQYALRKQGGLLRCRLHFAHRRCRIESKCFVTNARSMCRTRKCRYILRRGCIRSTQEDEWSPKCGCVVCAPLSCLCIRKLRVHDRGHTKLDMCDSLGAYRGRSGGRLRT